VFSLCLTVKLTETTCGIVRDEFPLLSVVEQRAKVFDDGLNRGLREVLLHEIGNEFLHLIMADRIQRQRSQCWMDVLFEIVRIASRRGSSNSTHDFLQKAFGYSLTGVTSEKAVFVLWGSGDNGKTTLLDLFRFLLSEYALLQIDTLMVKSQETNNTLSDLVETFAAPASR
jgi:hypothetical protein